MLWLLRTAAWASTNGRSLSTPRHLFIRTRCERNGFSRTVVTHGVQTLPVGVSYDNVIGLSLQWSEFHAS
jgi:hypothetical protein